MGWELVKNQGSWDGDEGNFTASIKYQGTDN